MSLYLIGILAAFAGVVAHAWTNIIDGYFGSKIFNRLANLIFFSALINLVFLPIVFFADFPKPIPMRLWGILVAISLIEVLYSYPYYSSLRKMDTSIIVSLFSLGKVFAPILAFVVVGERLSTLQYVGFFIIVISSTLLTLDLKKLRLNPAFFLMLSVSVLLTVQSVLYKYIFDSGVSWGSVVFWEGILSAIIASASVFLPKNFRDFRESYRKIKSLNWLFVANQFFSWGGEAINKFALVIIPVSIVKGITSTQSIFVLIFAFLFARKLPHIFKENIGKEGMLKKIFLLALIVLGTILVTVKSITL